MRREGPGRQVLIIEDQADLADCMARLLSLKGHRVRVARSGTEGLEVALSMVPEVILLDIGLPGLDGYEVASRLRSCRQFDAVLIVAITAYGEDSDRRRSAEMGINHHLVKPASMPSLLSLLDTAGRGLMIPV